MLKPPVHGEQHGCYDQGKPEKYTEKQLSRVYDILFAAEQADLNKAQVNQVFATLPDSMKLEFNYSNWKYQAA